MTISIGTVTVEATQLATDVHAKITDVYGVTKSVTFAEDRVEGIPWRAIAETHVYFSQARTRRN
jgi:hypothetical protein